MHSRHWAARLVDLLVNKLDARYRGRVDVLRPTVEILTGPGHSLLKTSLGPLDVLGAIEGGRDYDSLLPSSHRIDISSHPVYVLGLATLIELKRGSTRLKDQETLKQSGG